MSEQAQQILTYLFKAIETDQIKLPTLPEIALKIREAVDKDCKSATDIAALVSQDSSLSARLLQLANSPLYRSRNEINNLHMAVTRLGIHIVKDLVVMLAIKQAFNTEDKNIEKQFKAIWQTSVDIAAASRVLAKAQNNLDIEHAMLAGLIHNIGSLPIIQLADSKPSLFGKEENIQAITQEIQSAIGEKILSFWNFPQTLIDVVSHWDNFSRTHSDKADYVDVVQAAMLHTTHSPADAPEDWSDIPAINKLGLDPSIRNLDESSQQQLEETRASLIRV